MGRLVRLQQSYKSPVTFLFVAIRDAGHPPPAMAPHYPPRHADGADPEAWRRVVRKGLEVYAIPFPTLLDEDGQAERAYAAYPTRLVVVGADGRVVYDGGRGAAGGPSDWDLTAVERAINAALNPNVPANS